MSKPSTEFGKPGALAGKPEQADPAQAAVDHGANQQAPRQATQEQAKEPARILPTIGRRVWYWPTMDSGRLIDGGLNVIDNGQPCDAGVVFVHSADMVNLSVTDHIANTLARLSVKLLATDEPVPEQGGVAQWMPYQVGQARKA
jgi:hypothetical protein